MAKTNPVKERLRAGKPVAGVAFTFPSAALVEICGLLGFHYARFDMEHGPMDYLTAEHLILAAEANGTTPLVRPPANLPHEILRSLDAGALGLMVPHIDSGADAAAMVHAARFHPEGERGLAGGRWARYGLGGPLPDLIAQANEQLLLLALVESKQAVDNLDDILATPGVDAIMIGYNDLSQSLGLPARTSEPLVQEYISRIIERSRAEGKWVGMAVRDAAAAKTMVARGVQIVEFGANHLFSQAGRAVLKELAFE
jgi:4-hydroxy-2-oxoheptanedioate aldolase